MGEIVLITRTVTGNQGNEALSVVWRDFLVECYPDAAVRLLERAPSYLRQFRTARLADATDSRVAFDKLARDLVALLPSQRASLPPLDNKVRYQASLAGVVRFRTLLQRLGFRTWLHRWGIGERAFVQRLDIFRQADCVVLNPAGEFAQSSRDISLVYLLDIRCAQLLGTKTAIVNLSFEVTDPRIRDLSAHVFDKCDLLEFRDTQSRDTYRAAGGTKEPVILPDAAILASANIESTIVPRKAIALVFNVLQMRAAGLEAETLAFIDRLISEGLNCVLTTNEWVTDAPYWQSVVGDRPVPIEGYGLGYRDYIDFLGGFEVVVTCRLHSGVLAVIAGVPVVPLEIGTFKLSGFFARIGFDVATINLGGDDWQDRTLDRIKAILGDRDGVIARQSARRGTAIASLRNGLTTAFRAAIPEVPGTVVVWRPPL